jgi:ABC-type nitrate/sulfonate/bicarbonate transport system substrate-binding protein
LRTALEHIGVGIKDVAVISMGGIPDILAGMRAGAVSKWRNSLPAYFNGSPRRGLSSACSHPCPAKEFTFSGIAAKRTFIQGQPNLVRDFMAALTDGARIYKEDNRAAVRILRKYLRAEDRTLEEGYKEYDAAFPARRIRLLKRWKLCATTWSIQRRSSKKSISKCSSTIAS